MADSYDNMAIVYKTKAELDRALELHTKSLTIRLSAVGADHPDVAGSYNNIAIVYRANEDVDKALAYSNKSMLIT